MLKAVAASSGSSSVDVPDSIPNPTATVFAEVHATLAPTSGDDTTLGYVVGDLWFNVTTGQAFIAQSVTEGNAEWSDKVSRDTLIENIQFDTQTRDPTTTDDVASYSVGSVWYNSAKGFFYICTDNTDDAAVWAQIALSNTHVISSVDPTFLNMAEGAGVGAIFTRPASGLSYVMQQFDRNTGVATWRAITNQVVLRTTSPGANNDLLDGFEEGTSWYNTDHDLLYVSVDDTDDTAVWKLLNYSRHPGYVSSNYYVIAPVLTTFDGTPTADLMVGYFVKPERPITFSNVAVKVATAQATKSVRVGIYEHDWLTGEPDTLITETASHELDSTTDGDNVIALGAAVAAGPFRPFWVFTNVDSTTAQLKSLLTADNIMTLGGANQTAALAAQTMFRKAADTFGAFADPAPVTTLGVVGVDEHCPVVFFIAD